MLFNSNHYFLSVLLDWRLRMVLKTNGKTVFLNLSIFPLHCVKIWKLSYAPTPYFSVLVFSVSRITRFSSHFPPKVSPEFISDHCWIAVCYSISITWKGFKWWKGWNCYDKFKTVLLSTDSYYYYYSALRTLHV